MENYPDFEKLAHVIQYRLQGFVVENIEGQSTEANESYFVEVDLLPN